MKKVLSALIICTLVMAVWVIPARAEYEQSYHFYMTLGIKAFDKGYYQKAIDYFESAHQIDPDKTTPLKYINLIRRYKDDQLQIAPSEIPAEKAAAQSATAAAIKQVIKPERTPAPISSPSPSRSATESVSAPRSETVIRMDDALWSQQSKSDIVVDIQKPYTLQGRNIARFLVVSPDLLKVERVDKDTIRFSAKGRGASFLHVWDDRGRWTLHIRGTLPEIKRYADERGFEVTGEEYAPPFKVSYSNDWGSTYLGNSAPDLARTNLTFSQWVGTSGETPYGYVDASMNFYKFPGSTERVGERVGLSNGRIGPFEDFSIRGFDTNVYFSDLSVPGRSFRGVKLDAYAFDRNFKYTVFQGHDQAQFLFISPGISDIQKTYIEGASGTLFPEGDHQYTFNYARGYGDYRDDYLKDKVYSVETLHRYGDLRVAAEVGYDEDVTSSLVRTELNKDRHRLMLNLRDIDEDYVNIVGRPSNRGEAGGNLNYYYKGTDARVTSNLDVYRDRWLPNPDQPNGVNLDWNGSLYRRLTPQASWTSSAYSSYTPQMISPRTTFNIVNRYTYQIPWWGSGRFFSFSLGHGWQRNRYDKSPESEFDRNTLLAGIRVPLIRNMSYYTNYEYSWAVDIFRDTTSHPQVWSSGIDYFMKISEPLSLTMDLRYRDEQNSEGTFSFLSGEDYVRGSLGLNYRPSPGMEIYCDGSLRSVWTENPDNPAFNDADVRFGVRASWDTFFRWSPQGTFTGTIYKDLNYNQHLDPNEPGIAGIGVKVGNQLVTTDELGRYFARVRAKKVRVALDVSSLPQGFLTTNGYSKDLLVENGETYTVDIGLTTRSGIYGVVYVDLDRNGQIDSGDTLVSNARMILDGTSTVYSDVEGTYSFNNIEPGVHTLELDVNSLPIEYLPLIKLSNEIDVREGVTYLFNVPLRKK